MPGYVFRNLDMVSVDSVKGGLESNSAILVYNHHVQQHRLYKNKNQGTTKNALHMEGASKA